MAFLVCKDEILKVHVVITEDQYVVARHSRKESRNTRGDAHFVCERLEEERLRQEFPAQPNC